MGTKLSELPSQVSPGCLPTRLCKRQIRAHALLETASALVPQNRQDLLNTLDEAFATTCFLISWPHREEDHQRHFRPLRFCMSCPFCLSHGCSLHPLLSWRSWDFTPSRGLPQYWPQPYSKPPCWVISRSYHTGTLGALHHSTCIC